MENGTSSHAISETLTFLNCMKHEAVSTIKAIERVRLDYQDSLGG